MRYEEVYGNIAREQNGRGKFIMLLTFELSSFRQNGIFFYYIFHAVATDTSHWTPKSARRQNRENGHTTHTQTTTVPIAHARRG